MQELQAHVVELVKQSNKSNAQIARESGVGESTVRRFMNGESCSVDTLTDIAKVVNVTTNDLKQCLPAQTAVAMEIFKREIEQEMHPNSPHCSTDCTARKAFNENLAHITDLYEKRLDERKELYEARLAEQKELYERSLAIKNTQLDKRDADIAALNAKHESDIARLKAEYEAEIATNKADYLADAATAETKYETRISRFRRGTFVMLGIILLLIVFIWYLIFVDFRNPNEGILTTDLLISALEKAGYKIIAP